MELLILPHGASKLTPEVALACLKKKPLPSLTSDELNPWRKSTPEATDIKADLEQFSLGIQERFNPTTELPTCYGNLAGRKSKLLIPYAWGTKEYTKAYYWCHKLGKTYPEIKEQYEAGTINQVIVPDKQASMMELLAEILKELTTIRKELQVKQ